MLTLAKRFQSAEKQTRIKTYNQKTAAINLGWYENVSNIKKQNMF